MRSLDSIVLSIEKSKQIMKTLGEFDKELEKAGELLTEARVQVNKTFWDLLELRTEMLKKVKSNK